MRSAPARMPAHWAASLPPLQRFLTACHTDFASDNSGEVAHYIPGTLQGQSRSFRHQPRDAGRPCLRGRRHPRALHHPVDVEAVRVRAGARHAGRSAGGKRDRRRTVGRSLQFDPAQCREPSVQPDGQCRCDRLLRPDSRSQGRRRLRIYPLQALGRFAGRELEMDEAVFASESTTGDRNRAIGYLLRNSTVIKEDVGAVLEVYFRQCSVLVTARDIAIMAATLANRGVNPVTGEQVDDALRDFADPVGDDEFGHVRLRRRVDLSRRHPRQERRRRRHSGGAAGAARARQLFAAARQPRQQRPRHQGLRGAVAALRPAHAQPQRRFAQFDHRRLQYRQERLAAQPQAARAEDPLRTSSRRSRPRTRGHAVVFQCRLRLAPACEQAAAAIRHFRPAPRRRADAGRRAPARGRVSRARGLPRHGDPVGDPALIGGMEDARPNAAGDSPTCATSTCSTPPSSGPRTRSCTATAAPSIFTIPPSSPSSRCLRA